MTQETISLELQSRDVVGKQVKALRRDGLVPAVIHDHGKPSVHVMAPYLMLHKVYLKAGKHHPLELKTPEQKYTALIKDITFEPRKHQINHVVFGAVKADEKVEAEIPIKPRYAEENDASPAERAGLLVLSNLESVLVEALPSKLPDALEYDGEKLVEIGDHVTVADLLVPEGVEVKTEAEHTIATVYEPSAVAAANEALAGEAEAEEAKTVEAEQGAAEEGGQTEESKETKPAAEESTEKPSNPQ